MNRLFYNPLNLLLTTLLAMAVAATSLTPVKAEQAPQAQGAEAPRVLITNDNGIEDPKIKALARAFLAAGFEPTVVAPAEDRSGTGNFSRLMSQRPKTVDATEHDFGEGISAFALDGFPADCVLFAVTGLMADRLPDLVVSGINGGPNLGPEWFGSGTIGAARTAAFGGMPAIAISGLDDDDARAVTAHTEWVVQLAKSRLVAELKPGEYLTVGMPRKSPEKIRGVRFADRAGVNLQALVSFEDKGKADSADSNRKSKTTRQWRLRPGKGDMVQAEHDVELWSSGYIVVTPMRVGEVDLDRLSELSQLEESLFPPWKGSSP